MSSRRLSWSQFNMHRDCAYRWYVQYVLKKLSWSPVIYFAVGTAAHRVLEASLLRMKKGQDRLNLDAGIEMFAKVFQKEGFGKDPDELIYWKMAAEKMLAGWGLWVTRNDVKVIECEKKITRSNIMGIVDAILMVNSQRYIVDWKTSSSPFTQARVDKDQQVTMYQWLANESFTTKVAYGVLIKGSTKFQFLESERTQEDVDALMAEVKLMRETIVTYNHNNQPKKNVKARCDYCDVFKAGLCEGRDDF